MVGKNRGLRLIKDFLKKKVNPEAQIIADQWRAYQEYSKFHKNVKILPARPRKPFLLVDHLINKFRSQLCGVHFRGEHLQAYLNYFSYRYNRYKMKEEIFDDLLEKVIINSPAPYRVLNKGYD